MSRLARLRNKLLYRYEGILFIMPWTLGFLIFVSFPLIFSLVMSFYNVRITATDDIQLTYVGLDFYNLVLFQDSRFYDELLPFLQQAAIMIPIIVVFSLMIAILLNQKFFGRGLFRALFFLPVIFASGNAVQKFMDTGQGQLGFLENLGIITFVTEYLPEAWATPIGTVLEQFVLILWYSGVQILLFLAGRQTISVAVYEAARIDGATPWETFWKITLPAMTPFIFLNVIYTVVELFTFPGNPVLSNELVNTRDYGYSSALVWVYFSIILVFLGIVFLLFARINRGSKKTY